ncbi:MAG: transposase [Deltaproteobacteria bacterium]|nr:MAG: transposase [Deltaproteobacteria bacterium]
MSRPLRIEYPGAWYHVMNRGRRKEEVFTERKDYIQFIEILKETAELFNMKIAAYCMMPNHYHLLLQTPDGNLSRGMRHINGVYTQRFNRVHKYDGQLFRGRYKSILIEADEYLLQLLRYIHKNPLRAGLIKDLNEYEWSSHRGYISNAKRWEWLYKGFPLSLLSKDPGKRRSAYMKYMAGDVGEEIEQIFGKKRHPSILGKEDFVYWVKNRFFETKAHIEVPDSRLLAPDRERIQDLVCRTYGITKEELLKSRRGTFNEARGVAIYLTRMIRSDGLIDICRDYNLKRYSSASSIIETVKSRLSKDRKLRGRINEVSKMLIKGQT